MDKKKYKNTTVDRLVAAYPDHKVFMMFEAERSMKFSGKSQHAKRILNDYYAGKSESEKTALLEYYEKNIKPWKKAS